MIYNNINEFLNEYNLDRFKENDKCYAKIVEALDFDSCKVILLRYLSRKKIGIKELRQKYIENKYLNNIYKHRGNYWEWDTIGDEMLRNGRRTIQFRVMSNCERTCIAKACAGMVVENY